MFPRPPFVPAWIPGWALVLNTVFIETAIILVLYWTLVRRAEKKRRAMFVFFPFVALVVLLQLLGAMEVLGPPRRRAAVFAHDRFPGSEHPQKFARFYFSWQETLVLGRASRRNLVIDECPTKDGLWVDMSLREGFEVRFPGGGSYEGKLPPALWALHDEPEDARTSEALWEALRRDALVDQSDEVARFVGKDRH